jgi:hypothetical protein
VRPLRVGAEAEHGHGAEADRRLERDRDRLVDAGQRLDRESERDAVAALPADVFGEGNPNSPISPISATMSSGRVLVRSAS